MRPLRIPFLSNFIDRKVKDYRKKKMINAAVFRTSAILVITFVTLSILFTDQMGALFDSLQDVMAESMGWLYIISVNVFLIFIVVIMASKYGKIRIGGHEATPEFSLVAWFAMLFSAGMGIGLLFYSVAEPIFHFSSPPEGAPATTKSAEQAMTYTFLHWGLHPWAIYAIMGLAIGIFTFNKNMPLTIRSTFEPILKQKIYGWKGYIIDIIAVIATLFGLATSLGLGSQQINAGLNYLFDIKIETSIQIIIIIVITLMATVSVVSGLDKGIKKLSTINISLALILLFFVLVIGPNLFIFKSLIQNIGNYLQNLVEVSTWTSAYNDDSTSWQKDWTIFYWSWWIAWSPFVGIFIARISKGRTVREFITGVLLVPTLLTFIWITIFGGSAIFEELWGSGGITEAVNADISTSLFVLLEKYPLAIVTTTVAIVVVVLYFVTSSDSGSLVVDAITSGGNLNTPKIQKIFWALLEGAIAVVLLLIGGLSALQTGSVLMGFIFMFILYGVCYSLLKALKEEHGKV